MARGNHVDGVRIINKFGLFIVTPLFETQSFEPYESIYITKTGTLIGKWGSRFGKPYKDYLMMYGIAPESKLIRRSSQYLIFKAV
ncbi:hypothetical protein [Chryseobacterium sp. 5_R23647]|jgi:hypothetical protein|uniref:hypothetical protein n=1 Tax=Chryseobacterium sp. 5_R23647 TaxID=2258964 RepID=UPI000E268E06|nr:hypothetical protein [Chryseobacterium sp. 5_R23647]REC40503.1 hypothetical protein DRF69_18590 [Chryseobacterium sp. 5_R23647]